MKKILFIVLALALSSSFAFAQFENERFVLHYSLGALDGFDTLKEKVKSVKEYECEIDNHGIVNKSKRRLQEEANYDDQGFIIKGIYHYVNGDVSEK